MQTLDFRLFFGSIEPFLSLSSAEFDEILSSVDTYYFKENSLILEKDKEIQNYFIIAKGLVKENSPSGEFYYGVKDSFCAKSIVANSCVSDFTSVKECIIFGIKKEIFMRFFSKNENFKNYYLNSISKRIEGLTKDRQNTQELAFGLLRVKQIYIHEALMAPHSATILSAAKMMSQNDSDFIIINFTDGYGILTNTNLREKVILGGIKSSESVDKIAVKSLICVDENELVSSALITMIEQCISRVGVMRDNELIGVLQQGDILSANRAYLANVKITKAKNLQELKRLCLDQENSVKSLYKAGLNAKNIAKFVNDTNLKIYKRAAWLIFADEILNHCALLVTGSDGRGEQIFRTDQDNLIIFDDEFFKTCDRSKIQALCEEFNSYLSTLGFSECSGGIMVSNEIYRKNLSSYKQDIHSSMRLSSGDSCIKISIFADSSFVCGQRRIYEDFRDEIFKSLAINTQFLPHFARQIMSFETPLSVFSNFITQNGELDIKKGALFPIMHGIRALAIENGIKETNTIARIKSLVGRGFFDSGFAEELSEAFSFLISLRFEMNLRQLGQKSEITSMLALQGFSKFQRDILRDTLKLTNELKKRLAHHFNLGAFL